MTEPIVITFNLTKIALMIYGISKIALAIYLQRCYLKAAQIDIEKHGEIMTPRKIDMWGNFITNLLLALEITSLKAIVYPLKLLITGSKETFLEAVLPDEYKESRPLIIGEKCSSPVFGGPKTKFNPTFSHEQCNCSSNIDGRLPCPEHEIVNRVRLSNEARASIIN